MNLRQRKVHWYIWTSLFLVIPVMVIISIQDLNFSDEKAAQPINTTILEESSMPDYEDDHLKVMIDVNSMSVLLKQPFKNASATIYAVDVQGVKNALGQLTTSGVYQFSLTESPDHFIIRDELKDILITKIIL